MLGVTITKRTSLRHGRPGAVSSLTREHHLSHSVLVLILVSKNTLSGNREHELELGDSEKEMKGPRLEIWRLLGNPLQKLPGCSDVQYLLIETVKNWKKS